MNLNDIIKIIIEAIIKAITPTPTPTPTDFVSQLLLSLHNNHRQRLGLNQLTLNQALINAAQKHSEWMNQNKVLNHFANGNGPGDRITAEGYKWVSYGENIASGYATPQAVFQGWLNSSGHRANIENPNFRDVGFGLAGRYWTTNFASRSSRVVFMGLPGGLKAE
jgi:uncharacterized protein YkwD